MSESLPAFGCALPPSTPDDMALLMSMRDRIDEMAAVAPCVFPTEQMLHAGCYVRTCICPAGSILAGAVIKVPTVVVVHGVCSVTTGYKTLHIDGFAVLKGAAGRATVWRATTETTITMVFASEATSCEAAEEEFTDEFQKLFTRRN